MTRELEELWSDDPPQQPRTAGHERGTLADLWDHENSSTPQAKPPRETEVDRIWKGSPPPPPSSASNGKRGLLRRTSQDTKPRRVQRRSPRRVLLGSAALIGLLLVVDGVWTGLALRGGLESARTGLRSGIEALQAGDLGAARGHFQDASDGAASAQSGLDHPTAALASAIPGITRDVGVLRSLSSAGELAAESGLTAVELATELGVTSEGFASTLYDGGRVNLDALERGEPFLNAIEKRLTEAETLLTEAPEATQGPLDDARATALGEISGAGETARKASEMFGALPTLLGQDTKQRYFLGFQALGEARGTGGLIGLFGILSADDGEIALKKVASIDELVAIDSPAGSAPEWYETRYGPFGALVEWQQTNFSPNLPVVSEVLLERFEAAKDKPLDGVVMMDPIALGLLLRGTDPLTAEGLDVAITEDNAREVLLETIYEEFPENDEEQDAYLAALIGEFWGRIQQGDVNANRLISGMGEAVSTRHLAMYSTDDEAQAALVATEVDGSYDSYGPNVQMIFNNNLAANKLDYFMTRTINTNIVIQDGGDALVTTSVKVRNNAPTSDSALLFSGIRNDPPGLNRLFLNAMLPKGAQVQRLRLDGEFRPEVPDDEDGYPTVWDIVVLEAGQAATMKITYLLEDAFDTTAENSTFDMTLIPQVTVTPDGFALKVIPPDGFSASISEANAPRAGDTSVNGVLDRVRSFQLNIEGK